jgi:hypothetical protein
MPVISTAFDDDVFDEPALHSDRIESKCKRKCSKILNLKINFFIRIHLFLRMRYEYI